MAWVEKSLWTLLITWRKQSKISKLQRSIMTSFGKPISSSKSLVLCFVPWCILPIHWGKVPLKILPSHLHLDDNQWNPQRYPTLHKGSTVKPGILQIFNHPSGRADPTPSTSPLPRFESVLPSGGLYSDHDIRQGRIARWWQLKYVCLTPILQQKQPIWRAYLFKCVETT